MSNKMYYFTMVPIIIIGYILVDYHQAIQPFVVISILLALCYFGWEDLSKKVEKANGEEIRRISVPFILLSIFTVIGIISLFV